MIKTIGFKTARLMPSNRRPRHTYITFDVLFNEFGRIVQVPSERSQNNFLRSYLNRPYSNTQNRDFRNNQRARKFYTYG